LILIGSWPLYYFVCLKRKDEIYRSQYNIRESNYGEERYIRWILRCIISIKIFPSYKLISSSIFSLIWYLPSSYRDVQRWVSEFDIVRLIVENLRRDWILRWWGIGHGRLGRQYIWGGRRIKRNNRTSNWYKSIILNHCLSLIRWSIKLLTDKRHL